MQVDKINNIVHNMIVSIVILLTILDTGGQMVDYSNVNTIGRWLCHEEYVLADPR